MTDPNNPGFETNNPGFENNNPEDFRPNNTNNQVPNTGDGFGTSEFGKRLDYSQPKWNDIIFAIIFIAHLIIMFIALIASWSASSTTTSTANSGFVVILVSAILGAIFGFIWIKILQRFSSHIIKAMLWINLTFLIIGVIVNFASQQIFGGIIFLILVIFFGIYMYSIWNRIPFATALLEIATIIIDAYPATVLVAFGILGLQILWILWWAATTAAYMSQNNSSGGVIFLLLISFYWTFEVLKNISHTTTCGVAATWYFTAYPASPTKASLKRACTYSLGSICFGSLIVAFIQALRALIRSARNAHNNGIFLCIMDCLLGCIESLIRYFNIYAYAQIAIYGRPYIESAKATWELLRSKGIDALINDDLTGFALLCGSFVGGIFCAIIAVVMAYSDSSLKSYATAFGVIGFVIGFFLCMTTLNVVRSAIVTLFVCYAEDPNALQTNHSQVYYNFEQARAKMYPNYNNSAV